MGSWLRCSCNEANFEPGTAPSRTFFEWLCTSAGRNALWLETPLTLIFPFPRSPTSIDERTRFLPCKTGIQNHRWWPFMYYVILLFLLTCSESSRFLAPSFMDGTGTAYWNHNQQPGYRIPVSPSSQAARSVSDAVHKTSGALALYPAATVTPGTNGALSAVSKRVSKLISHFFSSSSSRTDDIRVSLSAHFPIAHLRL
jgi:hypothetical protein